MRTYINELKENENTKISGLVTKVRDTKYMVFVMLRDNTGEIQVSIDKATSNIKDEVLNITNGSFVTFGGHMVLSEYVKNGGKEFIPDFLSLDSIADTLPIDDNSELDSRLDYRWIDLRSDKNNKMFEIQSDLVRYMREYLYENRFTEIHTPKIIPTASESGSEVFEVKYFDGKAYLAQSPQFYKQMAMASGLNRIFEVAPCFRAENSNTSRHATEFTSFDVEFSYIDSYQDVMNLEAEMLRYALSKVSEKHKDSIENLFGSKIKVPTLPFPVMTLSEVYRELEERYGYKVPEDEKTDLTTEAEKLTYKLVQEKYDHEFLFVVDYPADKRAFYHMRDKEGKLQGYDLIWRGVEITSGAQREHRYEEICKNAESKGLKDDVKFYLEFFKYGCPTHGGFAIGVDRLTMLLLNTPSVKETQFLFRGPNRLNP